METVYLAQNKNKGFRLYALVTQYIFLILVLTIGFFLLGRYVIFQTVLSGGIFATIGAIIGIITFVIELIKIGKTYENK